MPFILIVLAIALYAGLYLLWQAFGPNIGILSPILRALNDMLFVTDDVIFVIFRGLLLISLIYVTIDFFMSHARRRLKRKENGAARASIKNKSTTPTA